VADLVSNAAVGGLASVAGGGKFANGAVTGAFGYLFSPRAGGPEDAYDQARLLEAKGFPDPQDYPQFIHWHLSSPSDDGGYLIQDVDVRSSMSGANVHYWEAWHVSAGRVDTDEWLGTPTRPDDSFTTRNLPRGQSITWNTSASFYEGLAESDMYNMGFSRGGGQPSEPWGTLLYTRTAPNISNNFYPSNAVSRTFCLPIGRC
jgi:hypothetical protein